MTFHKTIEDAYGPDAARLRRLLDDACDAEDALGSDGLDALERKIMADRQIVRPDGREALSAHGAFAIIDGTGPDAKDQALTLIAVGTAAAVDYSGLDDAQRLQLGREVQEGYARLTAGPRTSVWDRKP